MENKLLMKAAVCNEWGKPLEIKKVEIPNKIGPNQCLVRIKASGVCHTDLHACEGDWPVKSILPLIPGHEGCGEVIAVGSSVTRVKVGEKVGIPWLYSACGECEYCTTGRETLCGKANYGGYTVNGGYAEYCLADARYVAKVPESVSYEDAAPILCAGVTTYKALKQSKVKPGEWVAIFGIGGLGHLAVQYAKAMAMKVIAIDIDDEKLGLAKRCGADLTINSKNVDVIKTVFEKTGGAHGSVCTAVSKVPFKQAFDCLRSGGTVVPVGLPPENMELPIFDTVLKEVHVVGSLVGTRKDMEEALEFAADGKVKAEYELAKLDDINQIFDDMKKGKIVGRIVMKF